MQRIGKGLQYMVYDCGNGRVRKTPTSLMRKLLTLYRWGGERSPVVHLGKSVRFAQGSNRTMVRSIEGLRANMHRMDATLLGNPALLDGYAYEQDRVTVFGEALEMGADLAGRISLIDRFVDLTLECWKYGFCNRIFNFKLNCGVTADGKVVLIDLGEIVWEKTEVEELLQTREWEGQWSFRSIEDVELKEYTSDLFNRTFTIENLDRHWRMSVQ